MSEHHLVPHKNTGEEHCLVGSFTGEVGSYSATEPRNGWLILNGNQDDSVKVKASLTARPTSRAGTKVGLSDPPIAWWQARSLTAKSYPGDNRLIASKRPQRRCGLAPLITLGRPSSNI